ncbi:MAG: hypothetical protein IKN55_07465 [Oscillospiraceae bacterium]|nr:hypothetical protein [Oscillospiraceae bacterium]
MDYNTISKVRLTDAFEGMMSDTIAEELPAAFVDQFHEAAGEITESDHPSGCRMYYALNMYTSSEDVAEQWIVDSHDCIISSNGKTYKRSGKLDAWLTHIETSYGLTLDSVYGRKPTANYFAMLQDAVSADFDEITATNFDKGFEYSANQAEISGLISAMGTDVKFSGKGKVPDSYQYTVEFFDQNGASLYILYIDKKGRIYTEYGYEITSSGLSDWLKSIIH